jgi:arginyl-tRNA synthetase
MIDRLKEFINSKAGYLSLFWIFSLLAVFFMYDNYQKKSNQIYNEYEKLKEIKFLTNNIQKRTIESSEQSIRNFLAEMGLNVESINVNNDTFEITMNNVSIKKLVEIIYKLEENGYIIKNIKAVDNTGSNRMKVVLSFSSS